MQFMIMLQKGFVLDANVTGMNKAKNQQKFFLNLEKQQGAQNTIKKLIVDDKEITDQIQFRMYNGIL